MTSSDTPNPTSASADAELVRLLGERCGANDSLAYAYRVFAEVSHLATQYATAVPISLLELGPGVNLGSLFCFAASGVPRAVAVDVAPLPAPPPEFYRLLRAYYLAVSGRSWWRPWAHTASGIATFPTLTSVASTEDLLGRIEHRAGVNSGILPFANSEFDLSYSIAALEHVQEPANTLGELWRTLKPGGLTIHEIDLKHHGSPDPLRFLEWSEADWLARSSPYGGSLCLSAILNGAFEGEIYCNRLRLDDWLNLFRKSGFEVCLAEPVILLNTAAVKPERLSSHFNRKNIEDLRVLAVRIVARRSLAPETFRDSSGGPR